jgi:hypothetical protein
MGLCGMVRIEMDMWDESCWLFEWSCDHLRTRRLEMMRI